MKPVHALIWRSSASQEEFDKRIPGLMEWLRDLYAEGKLLGCGGGGYEIDNGGLTLLDVESVEEAQAISNRNPMNEIGTVEIFVWDVFYGNLIEHANEARLLRTV